MGSNRFHFEHYYMHASEQALGVMAKVESASWGKCLIAEVATPGQLSKLIPMNYEADSTGWHEITKNEFIKIQQTCIGQYLKAQHEETQCRGIKGLIGKLKAKIFKSKKN